MLVSSVSSSFGGFGLQGHHRHDKPRTHDDKEVDKTKKQDQSAESKETNAVNKEELNPHQSEEIRKLANRDREVRAHEAAHKAAGGSLTGPAAFSYTKGPDGKRYASSGEVSIDTSKVAGDPQATLIKANQIRAAALAPAQPSNTDRAVAAKAAQMASEARVQILATQNAESKDELNTENKNSANQAQPNYKIAAFQTSSIAPPQATIDVLA